MTSKIGNISEKWLLAGAKRLRKQLDAEEAEKARQEAEAERLANANKNNPKLKPRKPKTRKPSDIQNPTSPIQPANLGDVFFLSEYFGKKVHEQVIQKYSDIEAITKVKYDSNEAIVKGSNPFYVVAVNEFLREIIDKKIRTATQADLERILREDKLPLENQYEDSGLVWRSNQNPNQYLATDIHNQFKQNGINLKEETAYLIQLQELSLKKDNNSPYKLSFILPDKSILQSQYFEAPILKETLEQKFNSSDIEVNTGLPTSVSDLGPRTLLTSQEGLSWLYLGRNLDLGSNYEDLANSDDDGRVVCVETQKNSGGKP